MAYMVQDVYQVTCLVTTKPKGLLLIHKRPKTLYLYFNMSPIV